MITHFAKLITTNIIEQNVNFPFVLFGCLLIAALLAVIELIRQSRRVKSLKKTASSQRDLADERDSFWHLAANYLRAPVTLIVGGVENIVDKNGSNKQTDKLSKLARDLQSNVSEIMSRIEASESLLDIKRPRYSKIGKVTQKSRFWIPIVIISLFIALTDYVAINFKHMSIGATAYATQIMFNIFVIFVFYWLLIAFGKTRRNKAAIEKYIDQQSTQLDSARYDLISSTSAKLEDKVNELKEETAKLPAEDQQLLREGLRRLSGILSSFKLLIAAQEHHLNDISASSASSDLPTVVNRVVSDLQASLKAKDISIVGRSQSEKVFIPGNQQLISQVVSSVLTNAIDYSSQGKSIDVDVEHTLSTVTLTITDHGKGISKNEMSHLFCPFMRADGKKSLQIDHGGLGVNLYIDKLIMGYLGGSIEAKSTLGKGTAIKITWPTSKQAVVQAEKIPVQQVVTTATS